jgi:hypothetical protein
MIDIAKARAAQPIAQAPCPSAAGFRAKPHREKLGGGTLPRIAFFFNAQSHQLLHGITIAEELALGWGAEVDILSSTEVNLDIARAIVSPAARPLLRFDRVGSALARAIARRRGVVVPPKLLTLLAARRRLNSYDAIALPERTSILLRRLGVHRPKFIHIDHGAGDRAAGFDKRIARFDFALMAGEKQRRRMLAEGLIRAEAAAIVGYPKFDAAERLRDPNWSPFETQRPIILYNPHFSPTLGSSHNHGFEIVRQIVETDRFNLIIAPHVRLCDSRRGRAQAEEIFGPFATLPQVHVDFGSEHSIDMTYTMLADVYLGDVSSQVYEFLRRPRPCLFINAGGRPWENDPNYFHWHFGPVIEQADQIVPALEDAILRHGDYADTQRAGFEDTFDLVDGDRHSRRAAEAIAGFLGLEARS